MTKLYRDADLYESTMQRRKILGVFIAVSAVCLLAVAALVTAYTQLPYNDPAGTWIIAATCVAVGAYMVFAFPYMGIKFKRVNAYCKMLNFISEGLKECAVAPFADIEDWVTRDGVDCNVAVFEVKNIKKDEPLKRQIFIDGEKDFPPFEVGMPVRFISQGNLMIAYEIQERENTNEPKQENTNKET